MLIQQDLQSRAGLLLQRRVYFLPQKQILKEQALRGGAQFYLNLMYLAMFEPMGGLLLSEWRQRSEWVDEERDRWESKGGNRRRRGRENCGQLSKKKWKNVNFLKEQALLRYGIPSGMNF